MGTVFLLLYLIFTLAYGPSSFNRADVALEEFTNPTWLMTFMVEASSAVFAQSIFSSSSHRFFLWWKTSPWGHRLPVDVFLNFEVTALRFWGCKDAGGVNVTDAECLIPGEGRSKLPLLSWWGVTAPDCSVG